MSKLIASTIAKTTNGTWDVITNRNGLPCPNCRRNTLCIYVAIRQKDYKEIDRENCISCGYTQSNN